MFRYYVYIVACVSTVDGRRFCCTDDGSRNEEFVISFGSVGGARSFTLPGKLGVNHSGLTLAACVSPGDGRRFRFVACEKLLPVL